MCIDSEWFSNYKWKKSLGVWWHIDSVMTEHIFGIFTNSDKLSELPRLSLEVKVYSISNIGCPFIKLTIKNLKQRHKDCRLIQNGKNLLHSSSLICFTSISVSEAKHNISQANSFKRGGRGFFFPPCCPLLRTEQDSLPLERLDLEEESRRSSSTRHLCSCWRQWSVSKSIILVCPTAYLRKK